MPFPLQVSFRQMEGSSTIEALVHNKAARLEDYADHILSCRVVVTLAGKHQRAGQLYTVRIDLTVPGEEIVVSRGPNPEHTEAREIAVAIRDAFDAARRQLEEYLERRRRFVKTLENLPHARVSKLFPDKGYGFCTTPDGREIYFHRESVLQEAFERLALGTEVAFVEEDGHKGPQASTVKLVGRHHHR